MMKKIGVLIAVCAMMAAGIPQSAWAQTTATGPTGDATAFVENMLEFSMEIVKKMDSTAGETDPWLQGVQQTTPDFDFGSLQPLYNTDPASPTYGQFLYMKGEFYYYVLLMAATSGRRYKITEAGNQLTGPSGSIARESVLLLPDYQYLDKLGGVAQGALPTGASVGAPTSATPLTESLVFQSDTNGASRIVRAIIAISGPAAGSQYPSNYLYGHNGTTGVGSVQSYTAWKPVTMAQKGGSYSGSITFTLVLN